MNFFNTKYQFILVVLTLLMVNVTYAQRNYTMYNMDYLGSAHYLNPAYKPNGKVYVSFGIGMNSFGVSHTGFNVSNAFKTRSQDDSLVVNPEGILKRVGKTNLLSLESYNEIFAFGFKVKENYFSFSITNRTFMNMSYTKDLIQLGIEGNGASFLGNRASLDNTAINVNGYVDYSLGYNRKVNEKLQVGGRLKLLSGYANVKTKTSQIGITTDAESYDLTLDGKMEVRTAGFANMMDTNSSNNQFDYKTMYNFQNLGLGLDLGAVYKFTDKISVSASLLDLGFITWKSNVSNYKSENVNYTFQGVDLKNFFSDSTGKSNTDRVVTEITDSLEKVLKVNEDNSKYTTGLNTRFYLSGKYTFNKYVSVSATLFNEFIASKYRASVILSGNLRVLNWLGITVNYSNYGRSYGNVGVGLALRLGPIQFFAVTDNILAPFAYYQSKNFHASFGFNLLIGRPKKEVAKAARID